MEPSWEESGICPQVPQFSWEDKIDSFTLASHSFSVDLPSYVSAGSRMEESPAWMDLAVWCGTSRQIQTKINREGDSRESANAVRN